MSVGSLQKAKHMVNAQTNLRVTLHVLMRLAWQREGYATLDDQRAILLTMLAQWANMQARKSSPKAKTNALFRPPFLLGSQTIILDDAADIDNAFLAILQQVLRSAYLGQPASVQIGPHYIELDTLLASGEAHVRSLLLGRVDAARYDMQPQTVASYAQAQQIAAQLPQILQGFGVTGILLPTTQPQLPIPYMWEAPDGSAILVINEDGPTDNMTPEDAINRQRDTQHDGPFLWVQPIDSYVDLPDIYDLTGDFQIAGNTLGEFVAEVRAHLPDDLRPRFIGELHLSPITDGTVPTGRYTAHLAHKQITTRLDATLTHITEPMLAFALAFGDLPFPRIQQSLLMQSWRLLLQNMSPQTFSGAVTDAVIDELSIRNRRVETTSERILQSALAALPGDVYADDVSKATTPTEKTYITVWNPHGHAVQQVVSLKLSLPNGRHPKVLTDAAGQECAFTWDSNTNRLAFRANMLPAGYAVFTLTLSREKTAVYNQRRPVAGRSIGGASTASLGLVGGRLDWSFDGGNIIDLLRYFDGGDAGDAWHYREPEPDVIMQGSLVDVVQIEATPTYERLLFRNRMRIAPALKNGSERVRGLRVLDIATSVTYYTDVPGLYFQTRFTNTASDHRLRAHIRTGIESDALYADSVFGITKRHIDPTTDTRREHPLHSVAALHDDSHGFALFTRGLLSVEPIPEDDQITLAVTLLRAVGWADKDAGIVANKAQQEAMDFTTEFMLLPMNSGYDPTTLMKYGMAYRAPLRAFQYATAPEKHEHSYLQVESEHVVVTALKPHQYKSQSRTEGLDTTEEHKTLMLRLLNPTEHDAQATVIPAQAPSAITQVNLAEVPIKDLALENGRVTVTLDPHQILTLRLAF